MDENKQLGILDIMSMISFFIGIANYSENLSQGSAQDVIRLAVKDIHEHLEEQDEKLNRILELLEGGK